jgi:uncharacterized protein YegP (UPF0339 family)
MSVSLAKATDVREHASAEGTVLRFKVAPCHDGASSWWLHGEDGAVLAWAGETFASMRQAAEAAHTFKLCAGSARFEAVQVGAAQWGWRTWRSGNKVESAGTRTTSRQDAEQAAAYVRANAAQASGP